MSDPIQDVQLINDPLVDPTVNEQPINEQPIISTPVTNTVLLSSQDTGTLQQIVKNSSGITSTEVPQSYTCPPGYIAEYPITNYNKCISTPSSSTLNCTTLSDPIIQQVGATCVGPAFVNYSYVGEPVGFINNTANIQCQYGYPVFNGTDINGKFAGNVMCVYQRDASQLF